MDIVVTPKTLNGKVQIIPSKSVAHRLLICASFANGETKIKVDRTNNDIEATASCLNSMGADIDYKDGTYTVKPIDFKNLPDNIVMDCGESGSTLRFLLPVIGALGQNAKIKMHGRLPSRPLSPLKELLNSKGMNISQDGDTLLCSGKIKSGDYEIDGGVSSQFISGLMFSLSILKNKSTITITGKTESKNYIDMTYNALKVFEADICKSNFGFSINGTQLKSPDTVFVEGDWSNGAFWLCASALSNLCDSTKHINVTGLDLSSAQGDRKVSDILRNFGCSITSENGLICTAKSLTGCTIDAKHIPDLVPALCTVAGIAKGTTKVINAERLRIKESDRLESIYNILTALGGDVKITDDGLEITGRPKLNGGTVDGYGDHRIVMASAILSAICKEKVIIKGAEAVDKSYPDFWNDFKKLGGMFEIL